MYSTLRLNVLPLQMKLNEQRFSFYKSRQNTEFEAPLYGNEIPWDLQSDEYEVLYTDFTERPDGHITVSIDLNKAAKFAKHYLNARLCRWFEGKAAIRRKNFVNNIELYFRAERENSLDGFVNFDRFVLRAGCGRITDGPELTVMYRGTMNVWRNSLLDYPGSTEELSKVVYRKKLYKYESLAESEPEAGRSEVHPILNRQISRVLGLPPEKWRRVNKLKRHTEKIHSFYKQWLCDPVFKESFFPDPDGYLMPEEGRLRRIPESAAELRFGSGVVKKNPMEGMRKGGAFRVPDIPHTVLFIIVSSEQANRAGGRLYKVLERGLGHFKGLKHFTGIPVHVTNHILSFQNTEHPLPEIEEKIRQTEFRDNVQYGAVYISPIHKTDPDIRKHKVYFRLKEMLLKYNITSQVIHVDSVFDSSFNYFLPNIATALTAKLGGIPWTLHRPRTRDLVIGIGAYQPKALEKTYLGSAFCFTGSGAFEGFESFTADNMLMLAGSFQRAVREFRNAVNHAKRVVLHFYKKISKEEEKVLKKALHELQLDVPVVVLTIYKSGSRDLVMADLSRDDRLPLSGIWYRSDRNQFLVCNNTRFDEPGESVRSHPFPVKVCMEISGLKTEEENRFLDNPEWTGELMEQVYQFSRLNWQTVSIKAMPVTIAYPGMVAQKFPYFDGSIIPEFGRKNFWFL
jgi:hypothetical protein